MDSDCDAGMCCVDNYRFQIVSKRALLDVIQNGKLGELNNITQIPNEKKNSWKNVSRNSRLCDSPNYISNSYLVNYDGQQLKTR